MSSQIQDDAGISSSTLLSGMSTTLMAFVFSSSDEGEGITLDRFTSSESDLPVAAGLLCRLAGLLLQAYWFSLKRARRQEEIPRELEYVAKQIWAGHLDFTEGTAISLLRHACLASDNSGLATLVADPEIFETWREMIQHRTTSYKQFKNLLNREDWYVQFSRLLDALPVLQSTEYENNCFKFNVNGEQSSVPTFPFFFKSVELDSPLFLYSFARIEERGTAVFEDPYSDYSEEVSIEAHPLRDGFNEMRAILGLERVQRGYVCLFGRDYEDITDLAWAISSVEGAPLTKFVERFKRRHERTSDQLDSLEPVDLISLAIAMDGPSDVLKRLLRIQPTLFETYLRYLERCKHGRINADEWRTRFEHDVQQKKDTIIPFLDADSDLQEDVLEKIELETMCWCLINAAGLDMETPPDYVESIGMRIKMVRNLWTNYRGGLIEKETVIINIAHIFERTLRFLICFYSGLQAYHASFVSDRKAFDDHEKSMASAAREAAERVHRATPGILHRTFRELCDSVSRNQREMLNELLGRTRVCDIKAYNALVEKWFIPVNPTKHDPTKLFFDQELPSLRRISPKDVRQFVDNTVELLDFLRSGRPNKGGSHRDAWNNTATEAVYPLVVSFREQHRKRDGLSIYNYRVHFVDALSRDETQEIKILTRRERLTNEQYYCIPGKATSDWWFDPFLIRCGKFHGTPNSAHQKEQEVK